MLAGQARSLPQFTPGSDLPDIGLDKVLLEAHRQHWLPQAEAVLRHHVRPAVRGVKR